MTPDFWQDNLKAKSVLKELESLKTKVASFGVLEQLVGDFEVLIEFDAESPSDDSKHELESTLKKTKCQLDELQVAKMLSGELDRNGCYLLINAGAGGTESCDWALMLSRMYLRYAEQHGFKATMIDFTEGDGAGYRSVTLEIDGLNAYGYLKAENGVHRLVRISPFDASKRRHTSFCSVFVWAQVDEDINIEVNDEDITMETCRASGAGGQKVNKTDSAVRLIHHPSGIVVRCQTERSQHQNRAHAMQMLKARLYELEVEKKNSEKQAIEDSKEDIGWGSQIRSYVLHPYQMVKDHRTNFETAQTQKVLDGEIDDLIKEYLITGGRKGDNV